MFHSYNIFAYVELFHNSFVVGMLFIYIPIIFRIETV